MYHSTSWSPHLLVDQCDCCHGAGFSSLFVRNLASHALQPPRQKSPHLNFCEFRFSLLSHYRTKIFEDVTTENTETHRDKKEMNFIPLHFVQRNRASLIFLMENLHEFPLCFSVCSVVKSQVQFTNIGDSLVHRHRLHFS